MASNEDNKNLVIGVIFVAAVIGVGVLISKATQRQPPVTTPAPPTASPAAGSPEAPRTWTRPQFLSMCNIGLDYMDCTKALGAPDRTQSGTSSREYYYWIGRTVDPVTGKLDGSAQVVLDRGHVVGVNFR